MAIGGFELGAGPYKLAPSGWIADPNTWSPVGPVSGSPRTWQAQCFDPSDGVATYLNPGRDRFLVTQSGVKRFFLLQAIANDGVHSTITLYGGTNNSLANTAISAPYFSHDPAPVGFAGDPLLWSEVFDSNQVQILLKATPTLGHWYADTQGAGGVPLAQITVPIGSWHLSYETQIVSFGGLPAAVTYAILASALSTSQSSVSDPDLYDYDWGPTPLSTAYMMTKQRAETDVTKAAGTPYYLIGQQNGGYTAADLYWGYGAGYPNTKIVCRSNAV